MGYYEGQREWSCPRCGGVVVTTFISVSPMSFSQRCLVCDTTEFTPEEDVQLGANVLSMDAVTDQSWTTDTLEGSTNP